MNNPTNSSFLCLVNGKALSITKTAGLIFHSLTFFPIIIGLNIHQNVVPSTTCWNEYPTIKIVDKNGGLSHSFLYVYQRVTTITIDKSMIITFNEKIL